MGLPDKKAHAIPSIRSDVKVANRREVGVAPKPKGKMDFAGRQAKI